MPAILRNLVARAPKMEDLEAVTELLLACDMGDYGMSASVKEDLLRQWRRADCNVKTDAWVIVTTGGQVVGYASVCHHDCAHMQLSACVHPAYRSRRIGMLLLRLAEARAREQISAAPVGVRVTLTTTVSHLNEAARRLVEREGYSVVQHFWRLMLEMDEVPPESFQDFSQHGKLKLDLVVDAQHPMGTMQVQKRTGISMVRQDDVYEKELRAGTGPQPEAHGTRQPVAA